MAIPVYESGGAAKTKASSNSLVSGDVTTELNECLLVYVTFKGTAIPSSVTYGLKAMRKVFHRINSGTVGEEFGHALYILRNIARPRTATITVTFAAATTVKSITPITIPTQHIYDTHVSTLNANTGAPTSTITATLEKSDELAFGFALAENSTNQTSPTFTGWTNLVDDSTVGLPVISNNHWIIGYKNLTSADTDVAYTGSGGTAADWVTTVVSFKGIEIFATDADGSYLYVGDTVSYKGNNRVINTIDVTRNVVELATDGWVGASETELV